jgi:hypothetical protein
MRNLSNLGRAALALGLILCTACGSGSTDVDASTSSGTGGATTTTSTGEGAGGAAPAQCGFASVYGDARSQNLTGMAVDATGAVLLTGSFYGQLAFGDQVLESATSSDDASVVGGTMFLAKLDPQGQPLWSKAFGPPEDARTATVTTDLAGNVLFATSASQPTDLGTGLLDPGLGGQQQAMLVKLDPGGAPQWSRLLLNAPGALEASWVQAMRTDPSGNTLVFAEAYGDHRYVLLLKIDPDGNDVWKKVLPIDESFLGTDTDQSLAVDEQGALTILFGAWAVGMDITIDLGGGPLTVPQGGNNGVLARFDAAGTLVYARLLDQAGGADNHWIQAGPVVSAPGGEVYVSSTYSSTIDLGTGPLTSTPAGSMYVTRIDRTGHTLWARSFGDDLHASTLALTPDGRLLLGGLLDGSVDFGFGLLANADAASDAFVAALDGATGEPLLARSYGEGTAAILSLGVQPAGTVVVGGAVLDNISFCDDVLFSAGEQDLFVAQLSL